MDYSQCGNTYGIESKLQEYQDMVQFYKTELEHTKDKLEAIMKTLQELYNYYEPYQRHSPEWDKVSKILIEK